VPCTTPVFGLAGSEGHIKPGITVFINSLGKLFEPRVTIHGNNSACKGACSMNGRIKGIQDMRPGGEGNP
jgi:hypothetical protein